MNDDKPESQTASVSKGLAQGSVIGLQAGCLGTGIIIGALLLGLWLDGQLHARPWFTLGLLLLGVPVSAYSIYRYALRAARSIQARERAGKEDKPPL